MKNDAYLCKIAASVGVPKLWEEDAAQEIRIALWKKGLDPEGHYPLYTRRRAVDFIRHLRGHNEHTHEYQHQEATPISILTGFDAEARTEDQDDIIDAELLLQRISQRDREILLLAAYGYNGEEIGRYLGISYGRVAQIRRRALKTLAA